MTRLTLLFLLKNKGAQLFLIWVIFWISIWKLLWVFRGKIDVSLGNDFWLPKQPNLPRQLKTLQRFVSSIGNIEKAMWVFFYLGRSGWLGWFGQSENILHTDINFTKDPWQFSNWYSKNHPNQKSLAISFSNQKRNVGSIQWLKKLMVLNHKTNSLNQSENFS